MTRRDRILVAVVAVELAVGGFLVVRKRSAPTPPLADVSFVDGRVGAHIRESVARCRTPDDWAALATTYSAYGYFPESEACARYAAGHDSTNADRAYEWAFALERIGLLDEANAQYERAAAIGYAHPDECWYYVARNWLRMENADAARAAFERAGSQPSARYELARLNDRAGDEAGALAILDRLTAEYPTAVHPHLLRHKIDALHDRPSALVAGDKAYRFQTRLPTPFDRDSERLEAAHHAIGVAHVQPEADALLAAGKWREAEPLLRAAIAEQWNPDLSDLLAEVEFSRGNPAGAAKLLAEAVDRAGASPHLLFRLGAAYEEAGQPDQAIAAWSRATTLGIGAEVKDSYYRLATAYEQAKKPDAAKAALARAFFSVGHEFVTTGRAAEALLPLEEATKADPQLAAAWFYRGEAHRLTGRPDAARAAYQKCLELAPNQGRARRALKLLDLGS
jgi:tetratricopeptide (TPR) repeat protein